ncbi:hypothetical protein CsSME_00018747 [Camellia sinensis var. sinensis]
MGRYLHKAPIISNHGPDHSKHESGPQPLLKLQKMALLSRHQLKCKPREASEGGLKLGHRRVQLLEARKLIHQLLPNSGRQKLVLEGVDKSLPSPSNASPRILPPLTRILFQLERCQAHPQLVVLNAKYLERLHYLFKPLICL